MEDMRLKMSPTSRAAPASFALVIRLSRTLVCVSDQLSEALRIA